mmetsp:Transcript_7015/g.10759  ORF Transcript_7015/g.10759 Transcript_7015/m.10759 type:complete len:360 (-) Transcript_7015:329-1408(-)
MVDAVQNHKAIFRGSDLSPDSDTMRRGRRVSCFDPSLMPTESIIKREMHAFSVHYSLATSKWIATLARPLDGLSTSNSSDDKRRCVSFPFFTEREARKFAKAYSPPKMMTNTKSCVCCNRDFNAKCRNFHCRNCGSQICDKCSARWGIRMIPKTYINVQNTPLTVRVCKSCDWLSNAFCMSLLHGKYENALLYYGTGNVNLRCTFADIHKEAMFPIHCAVMGGNLELVRWLVEVQDCPITVRRDPKTGMSLSIQTSSARTLIDLAMTGKPKVEILSYLVRKNLSVLDTKDQTLAPKTLNMLMRAGFTFEKVDKDGESDSLKMADACDASIATLEDAVSLPLLGAVVSNIGTLTSRISSA